MTDYFAAKNGDDTDPGTEAEPWLTVQKAADTLIAGDTVYIKNGIYNERVTPQNSGSPGNYITYTAYPGDIATIDGANIHLPWPEGLFEINNKRYNKIFGLSVINSMWWGILASRASSHIIIEKNYAYNCMAPGIGAGVYGGVNNIIVDSNEVNECSITAQEAISLRGVNTFEIKNNHVHHTPKEGIDAKADCSNGKIYKNYVHDCDAVGIYLDAVDVEEHNIDVYQNIVHDCENGIAIATEMGGTLENINIYNNIAYNNLMAFTSGDYIPDPPEGSHLKKNIKIINNTFSNSSALNISIRDRDNKLENFVVRNNILGGANWRMLHIKHPDEITIIIDHNLFESLSDFYGDDAVIGNPKFVNPSVADFHLQSDSPAINAGSSVGAPSYDYDGIVRPVGTEYDIGAYEYALLGTISGIVTDITTGLPISGVKITANGYISITE